MSTARLTEIFDKITSGSRYTIGNYDADVDIAAPKQYSITTGAKKADIKIKIKYNTVATMVLNTGLVIGTGGGAAAGTSLTFTKRDQSDTSTPLTVVRSDYVLGASGQTDGTQIYAELQLPLDETVISFKLKASTAYSLIITTVADNNFGTVVFDLDEE